MKSLDQTQLNKATGMLKDLFLTVLKYSICVRDVQIDQLNMHDLWQGLGLHNVLSHCQSLALDLHY